MINPHIMLVNTGLAKKESALLAVASCLSFATFVAAGLLGSRHLQKFVKAEKVVDNEGRGKLGRILGW